MDWSLFGRRPRSSLSNVNSTHVSSMSGKIDRLPYERTHVYRSEGRLVVRTNETDCRGGNRCRIEDKEINRLRDALYPFST